MVLAPGDDVVLRNLPPRLGPQHHHRLDRLAAVGIAGRNNAGFLNRRVPEHQRLNLCGPDLETRSVDHAFEPVCEEEIALLVDMPEIARSKKTFAIELHKRCCGGCGLLPVALKVLRPADDDFALLALRHFLKRQGVNHARFGADEGHAQALLLGGIGRVAVRRSRGFGQAIAFGEAQTVLLPKALRHRLRHGSAAAADVDQAAQVKAGGLSPSCGRASCRAQPLGGAANSWGRRGGKVGTGHQVNHHGRNVGPVRDAPARDQAPGQLAVPARHDDQRRAAVNGGMHDRHHAGDVKHRHHRQHHVLRGAVAPQATAHRVVHQAGMGVHAAFGQPGRAAGVGQHGHVLRPGGVRGQVVDAIAARGQGIGPAQYGAARQRRQRVPGGEPATPGFGQFGGLIGRPRAVRAGRVQVKSVAVVRDDQVRQPFARRQLGVGFDQFRGKVGRGDGDFGIRVGDVVLEFFGAVHGVHGHHHGIGPQDREVRNHPLRAVLQIKQHPVALSNAQAVQRGGQPLGLLQHFGVTEHPVKKHQRGLVGKTQRTDRQVVPQRCGWRRDAARQAFGPDLAMQVGTLGVGPEAVGWAGRAGRADWGQG